jgi:hypothetical protein
VEEDLKDIYLNSTFKIQNSTFIVRRSDWKIEATPQIGFFQRNQPLEFALILRGRAFALPTP